MIKITRKDIIMILICISTSMIVSIIIMLLINRKKENYEWTMNGGLTENNGMYIHDTNKGTYRIPVGGHVYRFVKWYNGTGGDFNILSFKCLTAAYSNIQVCTRISGWLPSSNIEGFSGYYISNIWNQGGNGTTMVINPKIDPIFPDSTSIIELRSDTPHISGWINSDKLVFVSVFWPDYSRVATGRYDWSYKFVADITIVTGGDAEWEMTLI